MIRVVQAEKCNFENATLNDSIFPRFEKDLTKILTLIQTQNFQPFLAFSSLTSLQSLLPCNNAAPPPTALVVDFNQLCSNQSVRPRKNGVLDESS